MKSYAIRFDIFRKMPKDLTEATYSGALCNFENSTINFSVIDMHSPLGNLRSNGDKRLLDREVDN